MRIQYKISLIIISIFLVLTLIISSSYALWVFNVSQESANVIQSDCFELTFKNEKNEINLTNSFPMKDGLGVQLIPYEFTIENVCSHAADLEINLETIATNTIASSNIKADINGFVSSLEDNEEVTPILDNTTTSFKIYEYTLEGNGSHDFNLRLWVKEDALTEEVENKKFGSKISVKSTLRKKYEVAMLKDGGEVNKTLKRLSGDTEATIETENTTITSIERNLSAPVESDNAVIISTSSSPNPVYAWFDNGKIYIYSEADKIYMNQNSAFLFYNFSSLTSLDLSYFDTSKVKSIYWIFKNLKSIQTLDVSHFDTSNVTNMEDVFSGCKLLKSIDVSNFNTSKVTNMRGVFYNLYKVTSIDVSHFDTSNVINMIGTFAGISNITSLDLSSFNTSNVTNMYNMFSYCSRLEELDLSNFDTSNVTTMAQMFEGLQSLKKINLSNFDTSKVTNTVQMFAFDKELTEIDLSSFDTSNVTLMGGMFEYTRKVKVIYVSDGWNTSKLTTDEDELPTKCGSKNMFKGTDAIVGQKGTTYDVNHVDKEYAHIDGGESNPGYLTYREN